MLKNMELVTKKNKNQLFLLSIIIAIDSTRLQCIKKKSKLHFDQKLLQIISSDIRR